MSVELLESTEGQEYVISTLTNHTVCTGTEYTEKGVHLKIKNDEAESITVSE